ncbi:MAG: Xaa-Pro peptidase family protein [Conexivisphaerales archaeon]
MSQVIQRLRKLLREEELEGFIHYQTNKAREFVTLRYLSGVGGLEDSGILIPTDDDPVLFVKDFEGGRARYSSFIKDVRVAKTIPIDNALKFLASLIEEKGLKHKKIGIDDSELTVEIYSRLKRLDITPVAFGEEIRKLRMVKTREELKNIRKAVNITENAILKINDMLGSGMTESELPAEASFTMEKFGAEKSFVHVQYESNASVPHHVSDSTVVKGDGLLVIDIGARVEGYTSDITRTLEVGKIDEKRRRIKDTVKSSLDASLTMVRHGMPVSAVARAARDVIRQKNLPEPQHRIGHGIGLSVHEAPIIETEFEYKLQEGMVLAIEPGIYIPGKTGCRIESNVVVRREGYERLDADT